MRVYIYIYIWYGSGISWEKDVAAQRVAVKCKIGAEVLGQRLLTLLCEGICASFLDDENWTEKSR